MEQGALLNRLEQLVAIGIELSSQNDIRQILIHILESALTLTNADGGTLYLARDACLHFEIIRNRSLGIFKDGGGLAIDPIPLYRDGEPNLSTVAAAAALQRHTINLEDAYTAEEFNFSGTLEFDRRNHYRSKSFLTVPMINHEDEVVGVLQLINAIDPETREVVGFDADDRFLVESLASQAAVVFNNRQLIDRLEQLFVAFVRAINIALDEKSPYTHGHCQRVPVVAMMLADAVHRTEAGAFEGFRIDEDERRQLEIAALIHDCGKIATPVHVVDKATKLEAIHDRIDLVAARLEMLKREARIRLLEAALREGAAPDWQALEAEHAAICAGYDDDLAFLRECNRGGEFMSEPRQARVRAIAASHHWAGPDGEPVPLLSPEEVDLLCIPRGTLSADERRIINDHISVTIKMLEALPWPKHLQHVPEYAGGHHERMDGKGYPRGLTREQMSVPARILAIADVFEALTARDRPYKSGKKLSEVLTILGRMCLEGHIDPDLFEVFVRERVYLDYARRYLDPGQIDAVDEAAIPGLEHVRAGVPT